MDEIDGLYTMNVPKAVPDNFPQGSFSAALEELPQHTCLICSFALAVDHGNFRRTSLLHDNKPLQWHFRTGHPSPSRYSQLSRTFSDVPYFPRRVLDEIFCIPCQKGKARRAAVSPTPTNITMPLELVHTDISGPVLPSISGSIYSLAFMDSKTAKSDVFFLKRKSDLANCLMAYKARYELETGCLLQNIRLDGAGENMSTTVKTFCLQNGIKLDPSPPHAHQSNGTAERLIQELWARTRVLLFSYQLPAQLWADAMNHANWLRTRLPSSRIDNRIPILMWNPSTSMEFSKVPLFGQPGFAFKYRADTVPTVPLFRSVKTDSRIPSSFRDALHDPAWRAAIDREYKSLRDRNTWEYVSQTPDMKPVPFAWVFRLNPLDNNGKTFLHKSRCVIRGDKQKAFIDYDPENVYAPVASHEAIRILLALQQRTA